MNTYSNISGKSNIMGYDISKESITVAFKNGQFYTYSYDSAGEDVVEEMKRLAQMGEGLAGYIQDNAKYSYE